MPNHYYTLHAIIVINTYLELIYPINPKCGKKWKKLDDNPLYSSPQRYGTYIDWHKITIHKHVAAF